MSTKHETATPETDAETLGCSPETAIKTFGKFDEFLAAIDEGRDEIGFVTADFAMRLERRLDAVFDELAETKRERDAARAAITD